MEYTTQKKGQKMKLIGAFLWCIGICMAGGESSDFVNIAGLLVFITGNLIIYKEHKNGKSRS